MAFDSFGSGGGKAWQTPAPAEKPESAAAAGHSLAPTMRVGGGPTDGCSSRPDLDRVVTLSGKKMAEPSGLLREIDQKCLKRRRMRCRRLHVYSTDPRRPQGDLFDRD